MADTRLLFDIIGRDKASDAFKSAGSGADRLKKTLGTVAKVAGGAFAVSGLAAFGADSLKAASESEQAQAKLQAAFSKFPQLAGQNTAALDKLNTSLARKTRFDDDATAAAEAQLAQFGLTEDQIRQLTPLVQDYAARTGTDLETAATKVGKAVLGQGKALKNVGLNLKDTGSQAGNFAQVMGGLQSKVGGFATKEGKTAAGQLAIMRNQFGEMEESLGKALLPVLTKLASFLATTLIPAIQTLGGFVAKHKDLFIALGIGIAAALVPAFIAWATAAASAAAATLAAAAPVIAIGVAIAALAAGLIYAYHHSEIFRDIVNGAFAVVKVAVAGAIAVFEAIGSTVARVLGGAINFLRNNWQNVVVGLLTGGVGLAVLYIAHHLDSIVGFFTGLPGRLKKAAGDVFGFLGDAMKSALNLVIRLLKKFRIPGFKIDPPGPGPTFSWPGLDPFGGLKEFAGGGIVPGPLGMAQLAIVHGGEEVLTPGQRGGGASITQQFFGTHDPAAAQREAAHNLRVLSYLGVV